MINEIPEIDTFTAAYIEALLYSTCDFNDNGDMGENFEDHDAGDFDKASMAEILSDCTAFQDTHIDLIIDDLAQAGRDFALTRNRHGAGFWDGDWPSDASKVLTDDSHTYGTMGVQRADDDSDSTALCIHG